MNSNEKKRYKEKNFNINLHAFDFGRSFFSLFHPFFFSFGFTFCISFADIVKHFMRRVNNYNKKELRTAKWTKYRKWIVSVRPKVPKHCKRISPFFCRWTIIFFLFGKKCCYYFHATRCRNIERDHTKTKESEEK